MSFLRFWVFMQVAFKIMVLRDVALFSLSVGIIILEGPAAAIFRIEQLTCKWRQQIPPKHYLSTQIALHSIRPYPLMVLSFEVMILNVRYSFPFIHDRLFGVQVGEAVMAPRHQSWLTNCKMLMWLRFTVVHSSAWHSQRVAVFIRGAKETHID